MPETSCQAACCDTPNAIGAGEQNRNSALKRDRHSHCEEQHQSERTCRHQCRKGTSQKRRRQNQRLEWVAIAERHTTPIAIQCCMEEEIAEAGESCNHGPIALP